MAKGKKDIIDKLQEATELEMSERDLADIASDDTLSFAERIAKEEALQKKSIASADEMTEEDTEDMNETDEEAALEEVDEPEEETDVIPEESDGDQIEDEPEQANEDEETLEETASSATDLDKEEELEATQGDESADDGASETDEAPIGPDEEDTDDKTAEDEQEEDNEVSTVIEETANVPDEPNSKKSSSSQLLKAFTVLLSAILLGGIVGYGVWFIDEKMNETDQQTPRVSTVETIVEPVDDNREASSYYQTVDEDILFTNITWLQDPLSVDDVPLFTDKNVLGDTVSNPATEYWQLGSTGNNERVLSASYQVDGANTPKGHLYAIQEASRYRVFLTHNEVITEDTAAANLPELAENVVLDLSSNIPALDIPDSLQPGSATLVRSSNWFPSLQSVDTATAQNLGSLSEYTEFPSNSEGRLFERITETTTDEQAADGLKVYDIIYRAPGGTYALFVHEDLFDAEKNQIIPRRISYTPTGIGSVESSDYLFIPTGTGCQNRNRSVLSLDSQQALQEIGTTDDGQTVYAFTTADHPVIAQATKIFELSEAPPIIVIKDGLGYSIPYVATTSDAAAITC